jgi:SAM-dependent methyltransferase
MAQVERDLWWYRALHGLVLDTLRTSFSTRDAVIVDAGCGTGGLMMHLGENGYHGVRGFDLSEYAVAACRDRGLDVELDGLEHIGRRYPEGALDVIISNDNLYFLDASAQQHFVAACRRLLKPGGLLIMNVPALAAFRGIHDVSVGIQSRLSRGEVRRLLDAAGFETIRETYWPFFVSPAIYLVRLVQRIKIRLRRDFEVSSDVALPPRWLNELLYRITRWENRWLRRKPFGSSLFIVGRRPTA